MDGIIAFYVPISVCIPNFVGLPAPRPRYISTGSLRGNTLYSIPCINNCNKTYLYQVCKVKHQDF